MATPDVLSKINDELQEKNEELQTLIEEKDALIAKLPTEEEYANLQREMTELQSQLIDDGEMKELKRLAEQGKSYVEIVRNEAKLAFKTKLMSDGVKQTDVDEHPEYLSQCRDYDDIDDVKTLYKAAQSHYRSARANRAAGRVSKELNDYTTATEGGNTFFVGGANDVR